MTQRKRILILTADAGFGHRSAANAIALALERLYGDAAQTIIVNPLDEPGAPSFMRSAENDYDRLAREWPQFYKLGYNMSDLRLTTSVTEMAYVMMMYEIIGRLMKQFMPDIVVVTFPTYQYPVAAWRRLNSRHMPIATIVTDLVSLQKVWFSQSVDLCIVPTRVAADLAIERGLDPEVVHVTGLPVNPALADRTLSKAEMRRALGFPVDKFTVLAVGSKRVERLYDFVHVLNHSGFDIHLVTVAGGNAKLYSQIQDADWHISSTHVDFVKNMPELMQAADCIVTKAGGLIVTESLACGLPMLLIQVIPGQETGNAHYVTSEGAGDLTLEPLELLETLANWLAGGGELFRQRAANALRLGRPEAAYTAAELIWQAAGAKAVERNSRFPISQQKMRDLLRQFSGSA